MDALSAKTDGKASEFRYLLPQAKNAAREGEEKDAEIKDGVAADYTRANGGLDKVGGGSIGAN
jgi:hypothetical protein